MTRAQTTADPDTSGALVSPQRRNFVFLAIVLGMLLAALDQTIVATALPTIVADLGGAGHQSRVVTSYLLASTITTALVGRLGDLFGRKTIFQAAVASFVADMLETAIGRLIRGEPGMRLRSIAMRPDCRLDVAELWALLRINRHQRALGIARITDIGEQFGIPYEVLEPTFDRLVRGGYLQRDVDRFWLTPAGTREVDFVSSRLQGWVIDKLTRSPNFQGRPDRAQVEAALNRITHRIVAQPDWDDQRPRLITAAGEAPPGQTVSP